MPLTPAAGLSADAETLKLKAPAAPTRKATGAREGGAGRQLPDGDEVKLFYRA